MSVGSWPFTQPEKTVMFTGKQLTVILQLVDYENCACI